MREATGCCPMHNHRDQMKDIFFMEQANPIQEDNVITRWGCYLDEYALNM